MKILLTGGTGQVGAALLAELHNVGKIFSPTREKFDLNNLDQMRSYIRQLQPDLIINPAAYTAVDKAESESEAIFAHQINALAPALMAEEAKRLQIGFIHFSTDYVFDGNNGDDHNNQNNLIPYFEIDMCNPINRYGKTKLAGEQAIQASGCHFIILRTSWVYSMIGQNFLLTMLRLANEKTELNIVNDQHGTPTSAHFLAQSTHHILKHQFQSKNIKNINDWWEQYAGIYHLTPNGDTNWLGFAQEIFNLMNKYNLLKKEAPLLRGIPSTDYQTQATRPINSILNKNKVTQAFQMNLPTWQSALESCLLQIKKYK